MNLTEIRSSYDEGVRREAFIRFGADPDSFEELEGSAPVYRCVAVGRDIALKATPGFAPGGPQVMGSTVEQIGAELDFVRALYEAGAPVTAPVPSTAGAWVEVIQPGNGNVPRSGEPGPAFFASAAELLPGELLPDDDVMVFPAGVVPAWGTALGFIHRVSESFRPAPGRKRLGWLNDDTLDAARFEGPGRRPGLADEYRRVMADAAALPTSGPGGGLCHGDPHHGNFMWHRGRLTFFDFDACCYGPYVGDVAEALYNCLPMPREDIEARRRFVLDFLAEFVTAYRTERPLPDGDLALIPSLLKLAEISAYGYYRKYWTDTELTERRLAIVDGYERRIAEAVPVVAFRSGDL